MSDLSVLGSSNGTVNSPPTSPNLGNSGVGIEITPFQPNDSVGQTASHNYRHSRAYRHFKNPPQPHMCIRTTTVMGDELFINVLSWTRIVIPQEPSDPIPLYGGMRVPPGSPRCPPLVYAVMANPEVLKDSGRHSKDPEERRAMVELMCDFVEAMNTDVKLTRNAVILKDRDISGELKDVWNAVQAQRDREREEQITQQQRQQQQHYHNVTTQQMFPKTITQQEHHQQQQQQLHQQSIQNFQIESNSPQNTNEISFSNNDGNRPENNKNEIIGNDNKILYMDLDSETITSTTTIINPSNQNLNDDSNELQIINSNKINEMGAQSAINSLANINFTFNNKENNEKSSNDMTVSNNLDNCINNSDDVTDSAKSNIENQLKNSTIKTAVSTTTVPQNTATTTVNNKVNMTNDTTKLIHSNVINTEIKSKSIQTTANNSNSTVTITTSTSTLTTNSTTTTTSSPTTQTNTQPTKKEKLGGFLPNGCIFPRFKNNKHKEKDKDKDNTKSSSNKEKTLLNSLKKVTSASNKSHQQQENKSQQYEKNCINLENEVEKLDLNKLDSSGANDMVIKVKVASSGAK